MDVAIVISLAFIGACLFAIACLLATALLVSMADVFKDLDRVLKELFNRRR